MRATSGIYIEHKRVFWAFVLIGTPLILLAGCILWREVFWDGFIWKYLWGPVIADAGGAPVDGVYSGYNPVNTVVYGIVLMVALVGVYDLIEYFDISVDTGFVLSLLPWVVLGGSLRTLEDAGLFGESLAPLFISPVIYLLLGTGAVLTMVLGAVVSVKDHGDAVRVLILLPPLMVYGILGLPHSLQIGSAGAVVLSIFYYLGRKRRVLDERYLFVTYGTALLVMSLSYNVYLLGALEGTNPGELFIIPIFTVLVTLSFALAMYLNDRFRQGKGALQLFIFSKLNLLIVFSHFFDASATYRGIKHYGYTEKHVIPAYAIELVGDPVVMFLLKLVLVVVVVMVMDVIYRDELYQHPRLATLLKFTVITLGLAPGVRNTLRLAMGV